MHACMHLYVHAYCVRAHVIVYTFLTSMHASMLDPSWVTLTGTVSFPTAQTLTHSPKFSLQVMLQTVRLHHTVTRPFRTTKRPSLLGLGAEICRCSDGARRDDSSHPVLSSLEACVCVCVCVRACVCVCGMWWAMLCLCWL